MKRIVRDLLIAEAVVAVGIVVIGSAADWTASDYTAALLVVCAVALFATGAALVGSRPLSRSGGAMADAIGRGSVRGTPVLSGTIGMAVDDDANVEPDAALQPSLARRPFPLVAAGTAVATGIAALISWRMI